MWRTVFATSGEAGPTVEARAARQVGDVTTVDPTDPTALVRHLTDQTAGSPSDVPTLVVAHDHDRHALRVAVSFLCSARPDALVAQATTPHAPVAALAALARAAAATTEAGVGLDLWRRTLDGAWSAAVLRSVAHLSSPTPTIRQHVASWRPTSRFLVRHAPQPAVVAATRLPESLGDLPTAAELVVHRPGGDAETAGPHATGTTQASRSAANGTRREDADSGDGHEDDLDALLDLVSQAADSIPVRQVSVPAGSTHLYGTVEEAQLALLPRPAPTRTLTPCHGCGLHVGSSACAFCGTRRRAARPATGAARARRLQPVRERATRPRVPVPTARPELARTAGPA